MVKTLFSTLICNQATSCIEEPNARQPVRTTSLTFCSLILHNIELIYMHRSEGSQIEKSFLERDFEE